jgi:hypothetical protein
VNVEVVTAGMEEVVEGEEMVEAEELQVCHREF